MRLNAGLRDLPSWVSAISPSINAVCKEEPQWGIMDSIFCSIRQAASALGVGRSKAYELMNAGAFETVKIGNRRLVRIDSVEKFAKTLVEAN